MKKRILFSCVLLVALQYGLFAQVGPTNTTTVNNNNQSSPGPNQAGCGANYSYDAAGNRIKRAFGCWGPNPGNSRMSNPTPTTIVDNSSIQIFPNPTKTSFTVLLSEKTKEALLKLIDIQGNLLITKKFSGTSTAIDISYLVSGIYMVEIVNMDSHTKSTFRLVKE